MDGTWATLPGYEDFNLVTLTMTTKRQIIFVQIFTSMSSATKDENLQRILEIFTSAGFFIVQKKECQNNELVRMNLVPNITLLECRAKTIDLLDKPTHGQELGHKVQHSGANDDHL